ncbi:MAG: putative DNA modification/repair radical SAM protein [Clostridia bacterium]
MEVLTKLQILADAAKYDVSCSSSGSSRKNTQSGLGNAHLAGICHSWSADGRCISLLKILFTNYCVYDCAYCVNRVTNDVPRAIFTPEEVADLTTNFYKRNYIEGLFLSSAVYKNPNYTMELLTKTVRKLREDYRFNGYIHLKGIPGADLQLINEAGKYADRLSVNIELPTQQGLQLLAPQKSKESIIKPMDFIHSKIGEKAEEKKHFKKAPSFVPAGQTTQLIVGATPDHDMKILKLSEGLYKRFLMKRVYYSAYMPVTSGTNLPAITTKPPLLREHRLYQADWLLRFYGFTANELLNESKPDFDIELDPKSDWALRSFEQFPIEVNRADYEMLLRVPGIGVRSAQKIVCARRVHPLSYDGLKKIGVVLKRAKHFITCQGKFYGEVGLNDRLIRQCLIEKKPEKVQVPQMQQISIFSLLLDQPEPSDVFSSITGEL